MAAKTTRNYKLVDDKGDLKESIAELKGKLERSTLLAVDCEGLSLSRKGALTILTVATEEKAYIFDVLKLGQAVFSEGLGEILEDKSREKLMFDCRQDSDALWHQFNVKLSGVLDLQLLEILYRRENTATGSQSSTKYERRSQRTNEVEAIFGFKRSLETYARDEEMIKTKGDGKKILKEDEEVWKKRPLSEELIQYCVVDTKGMFKLYEKLKDADGGDKARLRVASERYVDFYRARDKRSYDDYETNCFLPLDIIPEKGTLFFPWADTECTRCHRKFPREEFSFTQLRKREQKCRICKEIKRLDDVEQNRCDQWGRMALEGYEDYELYYSDEEDISDYGEYFSWSD
ncbi:piRNA biogenesis protein EXD1-like [Montipora capricornis]|uniref:piRNA biogenesis protein EXD1-like n=1 Tax=Montipora capricornis TaxID=246305 RepID=UPI0035F1A0F0